MNHNASGLAINSTFSLERLDWWPSWLSLGSNGDLSGTPEIQGTWVLPLKVTDWNGISNSKELIITVNGGSSVQSSYLNAGARIWPNPLSDDLWLEGSSAQSGNITFTVYDLAGHQLLSLIYPAKAGLNTIHCKDVKSLKSGLYLYQVSGVLNARGKLMKKD
jgi:hypothetical protein